MPEWRRRVLPRLRRVRAIRTAGRGRRVGAALAVAGLVAVVLAAVVLLGRWHVEGDRSEPAAPAVAAAASTVSTPPSSGPTGAPTPSAVGDPTDPVIVDARSAAAVLAELDQIREQAFAQRDPQLLAQVYVAGDLLAQDTTTLNAVVRAGCTLIGVRTDYVNVGLVPGAAGGVAVVATATLASSTLMCGGAPAATVAGAAATTLRIELTRASGDAYRIASQQIV